MQLITDLNQLAKKLNLTLDDALLRDIKKIDQDYPLLVSTSFLAKIERANPNDPLLKQILPSVLELETVAGYEKDPLHESKALYTPILLQKYHGRELLIVTQQCALHCRFCFRRHFFQENIPEPKDEDLQNALDFIAKDTGITEVILSGGDPLLLSLPKLATLLQKIAVLPHVKRLRIHTRLPIALPEKITSELASILTATRLMPVIVIHCNHAQEIDAAVRSAVHNLRSNGMNVLNQSVLLKDINDSENALCDLNERLADMGVIPYYLHILDQVAGAAHFAVNQEKARKLHQAMQERLPGYLVPRLVCEKPGAKCKTPAVP